MELTLPYPPSVNRYWRNVRGRTLVSSEGRRYRAAVAVACHQAGVDGLRLGGSLAVEISAHAPDRRRRDLDNLGKALLDAVVAARVILDDGFIDDLRIVRGATAEGGAVHVQIRRRHVSVSAA